MTISADDPLTPIPLVVLTGFLGAGKTTRLNAWLKDPALADTLVIINEFGTVGLDHLLVEEAPGDVVLLPAGCLCCTLRGDLSATLEDLLRRRDNKRIRFFRQVIIETTGLADPLPILQTVLQHPYFSKRFAISGVVTLVDAVHGGETLRQHPEAVRQVALADRLVITKADLAAPEAVTALETSLRDLSPTARLEAELDAASLFAAHFEPKALADIEPWLGTSSAFSAQHGEGIETFALTHAQPIAEEKLIVFQEAMRVLHGPRLLRLKGLIALADDPERPLVIHHVQSIIHRPVRLARWPSAGKQSRLVFITQGVSRQTIESFWNALVAAA